MLTLENDGFDSLPSVSESLSQGIDLLGTLCYHPHGISHTRNTSQLNLDP